MKKTRQVLAILGVILLAGMYVSTLIFALIDHSRTLGLLKASIALTILVPVLLYAYTLIFKLTKKDDSDSDPQ